MKLKELLETFIQTDKTFIAYYQAPYFIRMVKVPITSTVNALYASKTRCLEEESKKSYNFLDSASMMVVGYIDCHKKLRFPSVELHFEMVEDPESFTTQEGNGYRISSGVIVKDYSSQTPMRAVENAVLDEAKRIAFQKPLPEYKKDVMDKARRLLLEAGPNFPKVYYNFGSYIKDDSIIDLLAETEGWAEKIAKKWCAATTFAKYENGKEKVHTNLDVLREDLSYQDAIKKAFDKIANDSTDEVHQYIEMKNAVANTKTVSVVFKTESEHIEVVKVRSQAFSNNFSRNFYWISPYDVILEGGKNRMKSLLPTEVEKNTAGGILKRNIISIEYRGKKIWERKS